MSKNVFENRITIRQLETFVKYAYRHGTALFIYGGAGVGKSDKMRQIANMLFPHHEGRNIVDVRLSDKDPTDVAGVMIPVTDTVTGKTRTVYATPSFWPDADWEGIVFLDELTNASAACQQAAYQIMLDHTIGDYKFPKKTVFVAAGNREGDGGCTTTLLAPLANRMTLLEVEHNLAVWIEDFAVPFNIHPIMIGWLKANVRYLYTGDEHDENSGKSFCTPRSISRASNALYDMDEGLLSRFEASIILQGDLGDKKDVELLEYYDKAKSLPETESVLNGQTKVHPLQIHQVDLLYVLLQSCIAQLKKDANNHEMNDAVFMERIVNFIEFSYNNYAADNMDIIVAVTVTLLDGKTGKKPIVLENDRRSPTLIPSLLKSSPSLRSIIKNYTTQFTPLLRDVE